MHSFSSLSLFATGLLALVACGSNLVGGASTGSGGGASSTSSSGGDGGAGGAGDGTCGGPDAKVCPTGYFCSYSDALCGAGATVGTCRQKYSVCDGLLDLLTCGCDGVVYDHPGCAAIYGVDIALSGCETPEGTFACGPSFCFKNYQYCEASLDDTGGAGYFQCRDYPEGCACPGKPGCQTVPDCACLVNESCGDLCAMDAAGQLTVTCPGG